MRAIYVARRNSVNSEHGLKKREPNEILTGLGGTAASRASLEESPTDSDRRVAP
jgi:hypothetical protein